MNLWKCDSVIHSLAHTPTKFPSTRPTTSLPSRSPIRVGRILTITMETNGTIVLTNEQEQELIDDAAETFQVPAEDVTVQTKYKQQGTVTIDTNLGEDEAIAQLEQTLAEILNVDAEDVTVRKIGVNEYEYTVTQDTPVEIEAVRTILAQTDLNTLNNVAGDDVTVNDFTVEETATTEVTVEVDLDNSQSETTDEDIDRFVQEHEDEFEEIATQINIVVTF